MTRDILISNLRDGLSVRASHVTTAVPMGSAEINERLLQCGANPVERHGLDYAWRADDVLRFIFCVDPTEFRRVASENDHTRDAG